MASYTASSSISILATSLGPFSFDDSIRDITLVASSGSDHSSAKYFLNNAILPITLLLVWFLCIVLIFVRGGYNCCLKRSFSRIRQGSSRGIMGDKDANASSLHLVTIVSERGELIRGTIEDQVNYEIMRGQMKRVRNLFLFLVVIAVMVTLAALLVMLYLRDSFTHISKETNEMIEKLDAASLVVDEISLQSDTILDINSDLINSLGSQSMQNCFTGNDDLTEMVSKFSTSLQNINDEISVTNMGWLSEFYREGENFASNMKSKLSRFSIVLWSLISSFAALNVASLVLLSGALRAKKNNHMRRHRILYQHVCFPFLILTSLMLLLGMLMLIYIGFLSVDFCVTMGSPTEAVLAIMVATGYNNTDFYSIVEDTLLNTCANDGFGSSLLGSIISSMKNSASFESLMLNTGNDNNCSAYSTVSLLTGNFTNMTNFILPSTDFQSYDFECDEVYDWYANLAQQKICSDMPMYLNLSLLFVFLLVILSVAMIASNIAWKTGPEVFKDLYNEVEREKRGDFNSDGLPQRAERGTKTEEGSQSQSRLFIAPKGATEERGSNYESHLEDKDYDEEIVYDDYDVNHSTYPEDSGKDNLSVLAEALELEQRFASSRRTGHFT